MKPPVNQSGDIEAVAEPATYSDSLAKEYAKNLYLGSTALQWEFGKHMVTVNAGFFAAYFGVMKFLGAEVLVARPGSSWFLTLALLPPILLILSLICFAVIILPIRSSITFDDMTRIEAVRRSHLVRRSTLTVMGLTLFIEALFVTIIVAFMILVA